MPCRVFLSPPKNWAVQRQSARALGYARNRSPLWPSKNKSGLGQAFVFNSPGKKQNKTRTTFFALQSRGAPSKNDKEPPAGCSESPKERRLASQAPSTNAHGRLFWRRLEGRRAPKRLIMGGEGGEGEGAQISLYEALNKA